MRLEQFQERCEAVFPQELHKNKALAAAIIVATLMAPMAARAADCRQEHATYADPEGAYELQFVPADSEASSSTYRFTLEIKNTDLVLPGFVMGSEPVDRPNGMIFHNCPEGDVTGDDLAKCTVWQGVIYANLAGKIDLLPKTGSIAASEIVLPGFGPAIRESTAWGDKKASVVPRDILSLKGCKS